MSSQCQSMSRSTILNCDHDYNLYELTRDVCVTLKRYKTKVFIKSAAAKAFHRKQVFMKRTENQSKKTLCIHFLQNYWY